MWHKEQLECIHQNISNILMLMLLIVFQALLIHFKKKVIFKLHLPLRRSLEPPAGQLLS